MEKQFSHMFLGFIVVIFNFLKVRGAGGGEVWLITASFTCVHLYIYIVQNELDVMRKFLSKCPVQFFSTFIM